MSPIDPRLVRARRYPLHAAVALCAEAEVERLLTADADFHVVRKMPDWAISVVHSACSARHGDHDTVVRILKMLLKVSLCTMLFAFCLFVYGWEGQLRYTLHSCHSRPVMELALYVLSPG
jgi:hypothetical protein